MRRPSDDAPFRKDTKTVDDARAEGFVTGLEWNNDWYPGGPWVVPSSGSEHPEIIEYAKLSRDRNIAWHEGFRKGKALAGKS